MSDENQNEIIDLGFDQSEVQFEYPVLKECVTTLTCAKTYVKTNDDGKRRLMVEFTTTEPLEDIGGKVIQPGFKITEGCIMYDTGKMQPGDWQKRPAKIHFALTGEKTGKPNTGQWQGKTAKVKLIVSSERTDENTGKTYPARNDIGVYYPHGV